MLAALDQGEEPNHYRDAVLLSNEAPEWMAACTKEYDSLIKTGTWDHQVDVKTAFLYGDLDEKLYVQQQEGFIQPGKGKQVCGLLRPLYGLKQASRKWNEKFHHFLSLFGLTRSVADPCIYYFIGDDPEDFAIVRLWVDGGILATKTTTKAHLIISYLETHFEMTVGNILTSQQPTTRSGRRSRQPRHLDDYCLRGPLQVAPMSPFTLTLNVYHPHE